MSVTAACAGQHRWRSPKHASQTGHSLLARVDDHLLDLGVIPADGVATPAVVEQLHILRLVQHVVGAVVNTPEGERVGVIVTACGCRSSTTQDPVCH